MMQQNPVLFRLDFFTEESAGRFSRSVCIRVRDMLEDYAENNVYTNTVHFTDDGFSGGSFERPGWKQMLSWIENGDVGTVIVKDISRVGRDYLEVGFYTETLWTRTQKADRETGC